jgi:hypothetical protein
MLSPLLLVLCFSQAQTYAGSIESALGQEMLFQQMEQRTGEVRARQAEQREAAFRERQFVDKYNNLIKSLLDFADHYNSEHTLNLKRIKQVKKAWRDLEKTDTWFRIEDDRTRDRDRASARSRE